MKYKALFRCVAVCLIAAFFVASCKTPGDVSTGLHIDGTTDSQGNTGSGSGTASLSGPNKTATTSGQGTTSTSKPPQNTTTSTTRNTKEKNVKNVIREEAINLKLTEPVLQRSIVDSGNMNRLAKVIRKAALGEDVTIGVIGGSITEGTGASPASNKYAEKFRAWWQATFNKSKLTFVNAGMGATDSMMGVHRADDDLLSKKPDLVIIEFSVNDYTTDSQLVKLYKEAYESLVRKILKQSNQPAVILLFLFNQSGGSMQSVHDDIGKHYSLPMISYKDAVWPKGSKVLYAWSELSGDSVHPNNTGHAIISELLIYYINTVREHIESIPENIPALPAPLTDASFENGKLLNSMNFQAIKLGSFVVNYNAFWQFKYGWTVSGGTQPIEFKYNAKNIYILYKRDKTSGKGGTVSVKLDGQVIGSINSDYSTSWGDHVYFYKVLDSNITGNHTVEIQLTFTSPKTDFAILGLMVS